MPCQWACISNRVASTSPPLVLFAALFKRRLRILVISVVASNGMGRWGSRSEIDVQHDKKTLQRIERYREGVEYHLRCWLGLLKRQEKQLLRKHRHNLKQKRQEREQLHDSRRQSFSPDNPVTPDLRPLLELDPFAQKEPMSPLQLDMDSDAEDASAEEDMGTTEEQIQQCIAVAASFDVPTEVDTWRCHLRQVIEEPAHLQIGL